MQRLNETFLEYTVMQGLGRLYNGKHVVSPAYIGMEKAVVDYRVARANIVKDLLTNKESANFIKNMYKVCLSLEKQEIILKEWLFN